MTAERPRPTDMLAAFFALGIGFLLAAAVVAALHAATDLAWGRWLALHLAFVGGVSQLVLGAGQFFAGAFLATDPPGRGLVRAQLALWNGGTLLVAVGVPAGADPVTIAGAALLGAGAAGFVAGLRVMRRRSLMRQPWAVRWYEACALFVAAGAAAGVVLATGAGWPEGNVLGAHIALNLGGWFGTAIVGTLHTFFPSLTQTRLRFPALQAPTFACWTLGVAALAAGYALDAGPLVVAGWATLVLAAAMLSVNVAGSLLARPGVLALPPRLIAPAQLCLLVGLAVALVAAAGGDATSSPCGSERAAIAVLLLPGWLGLTVAGSLLHLLAVLLRVGGRTRSLPAPQPLRDRSLAWLALLGIATLAVARGGDLPELEAAAGGLLLAVYVVLGFLVVSSAAQALRTGAPRI